jgi:hypothetical protein
VALTHLAIQLILLLLRLVVLGVPRLARLRRLVEIQTIVLGLDALHLGLQVAVAQIVVDVALGRLALVEVLLDLGRLDLDGGDALLHRLHLAL